MLIILLGVFILLLILCYFGFKKEIINPPVIFCATYTFSILCACLNMKRWNINLSYKTFWILVIGAIEFVLVSFIIQKLIKNKEENKYHEDEKKDEKKDAIRCIEEHKISNRKLYIFLIGISIYNLIIVALLICNIYKISNSFEPIHSMSQMLHVFRAHTSYAHDAALPGYITLLMKPIVASAYIFSFIFFERFFNDEKNKLKNNIVFLIPSLLWMITCYVQLYREGIIIYLLNIFTMSVLVWALKHEWKRKIKIVSLLKMGMGLAIGLILFYYSAAWVGRENYKGMFEYITFYCGGSIECFNRYIDNPVEIQVVRGEETFYNLISNLDSMGITNFNIRGRLTGHLEFRHENEVMIGNVYTAYRRWLHDFGIFGMFLLNAIVAIVVNTIYSMLRYHRFKSKKIKDITAILFSYISYVIYMHPIGDYFYFEIFSRAIITVIVTIIIMYFLMFNLDEVIINLKRKVENDKK